LKKNFDAYAFNVKAKRVHDAIQDHLDCNEEVCLRCDYIEKNIAELMNEVPRHIAIASAILTAITHPIVTIKYLISLRKGSNQDVE